MKHRIFTAVLIAVFFMLLPAACKTQEKTNNEETVLQGTVKLYGSEPHTWVGIETIPGGIVYFVAPPETASELRKIRNQLLEFTVTIGGSKMPGADGTATVIAWRIIQ